MTLMTIIQKNMKRLFRSRNSSFVIIFGPLLIILLVGLAFNNTIQYTFTVGVYSPEYNDFVDSYIDQLRSKQFNTYKYKTLAGCTADIRRGLLHTCIEFPEEFSLGTNKTNNLMIYADTSNLNFVEIVIDAVSAKISSRTEEVSRTEAYKILSTLQATNERVLQDRDVVERLTSETSTIKNTLQTVKDDLDSLDFEIDLRSPSQMLNDIDEIKETIDDLENETLEVMDEFIEYAEDYYDTGDEDEPDKQVDKISNTSAEIAQSFDSLPGLLNDIYGDLSSMSDDLESADEKVNRLETTNKNIKNTLNDLRVAAQEMIDDLDEMSDRIAENVATIEAISAQTSAGTIASPIVTKIQPVTEEEKKLSFVIHHFVTIVIMFMSILLAGTLVIMEKTSNAFFRNFSTPVKDITFIISTFLTTVLVLLMQLAVIFVIGTYYLEIPLTGNIFVTLFVIILGTSVFTLIGMCVGYLFSSQETVTLASVTLGSIFLFTSNIILPIESMGVFMQLLVKINPYVMISEALRKAVLFQANFISLFSTILLIIVFGGVLFLLVLVIERATKSLVLGKLTSTNVISDYLTDIEDIPKSKYFVFDDGSVVKSKEELIEALKVMSDETFDKYVNLKKNAFSEWIYDVYKDAKLAERIRNMNRTGHIKVLMMNIRARKKG